MKNKLIIFDIDGTLTDTHQIDLIYFKKAIFDTFLIPIIDTNWHNYKYSTDSGIVTEIVQSYLNRDVTSSEIETMKNRFFNYLKAAFQENNLLCVLIAGSKNILTNVNLMGWDVGIATGGWKKTAMLKLNTAKIKFEDTPLAHSDDHVEREIIISIAIDRAEQFYKKESYEKIIYVGDKSWDRKAAKNLGIDFIGVGNDLLAENKNDFLYIRDYTNKHLENYLLNLI